MELKIIYGDIFEIAPKQTNSTIIHGANCMSVMGAGIAKMIAQKYPEVYLVDKNDNRNPEEKFSNFSFYEYEDMIVINAYTQYDLGANANYYAIETSLRKIVKKFTGRKFYFPEIGSGIGGGDREVILNIFKRVFKNEDATLIIYKK